MKKLAETSQVICITHLPQIAACADSHFQISKIEKKERVMTQVKLLRNEEREEELARMGTIHNASHFLSSAKSGHGVNEAFRALADAIGHRGEA